MQIAELIYQGQLRTEVRHLQSGQTLITDAPVDNHGMGSSFSPTDLMCVSLTSCMVTIMGIKANKAGFILGPVSVKISKTMQSNPRKVSAIDIEMILSETSYSVDQQQILLDAALTCPVGLSLHPDTRQNLTIQYTGE